jgi:hypothetical protein
MKNVLAGLSIVGLFAIVGCGGDDDKGGGTGTPEAACKSIVAELCSKFYGCLSEAELDAARSLDLFPVGNNEADCRTKNEQEQCTEQQLKCDSGKSYNSGKASECLNQYKSYSCDEFTTQEDSPAACEAICQ